MKVWWNCIGLQIINCEKCKQYNKWRISLLNKEFGQKQKKDEGLER